MHDTNPAQALVEVVGAIFYALLQLHGDGAEREAAGFIGDALSSGTIRDPIAKTILSGLVRTAHPTRRHPSDRATSSRAATSCGSSARPRPDLNPFSFAGSLETVGEEVSVMGS